MAKSDREALVILVEAIEGGVIAGAMVSDFFRRLDEQGLDATWRQKVLAVPSEPEMEKRYTFRDLMAACLAGIREHAIHRDGQLLVGCMEVPFEMVREKIEAGAYDVVILTAVDTS